MRANVVVNNWGL